MSLQPNGVVVTHPGKHYHVYQIALAAQESRMLAKFITGIYYKPTNYPYSLINLFSNRIGASWREHLLIKRNFAGLDPQLIVSMPYFELATLSLGKLPMIRDIFGRMNLVLLNNTLFDWWVGKNLRRGQCDIVHAFFGCAWRSFEQAKRIDIATVLDMPVHPQVKYYVDEEYERFGGTRVPLSLRERAEIELSDYVFAPSDFVVKGLVDSGFPEERVIKIPFGVDVDRFKPGPEKSNGSFRILFVGNLGLRKGFQYLLEAFTQLSLPGMDLTIIGSPVDRVSEKILNSYNGLFRWIPNVSYQQLHEWYQASDVFVFPSLAEGSAMVTYEAMACGLPLIVTENSGSIVRDGVDGFLIPIRDIQAIKERIRLLYNDRQLARRMGQMARQAVESYTWKHYRDRVVQAYREITKRRCNT